MKTDQQSERGQDTRWVDRPSAQPGSSDERGDEQERIARRAYERFQERGSEHGHDQDDWFEAEREVRRREERGDRET